MDMFHSVGFGTKKKKLWIIFATSRASLWTPTHSPKGIHRGLIPREEVGLVWGGRDQSTLYMCQNISIKPSILYN
jgi:hypothetical protein